MADTRRKNTNWRLCLNHDGSIDTSQATLAVLMDIRDELQTLNRLLGCHNFIRLPRILDAIEANTRKRKYTRKEKK